MKERKKYLICIVLLLAGQARGQHTDLIARIRAANQKPDMAYDYKIVLHDMAAKKRVDSTQGQLAVKAGQYRDSNGYAFTARVGDFFCKLDHLRKTATVCNMKELARRVGFKVENNEQKTAYDVSESLLNSKGKLFIDSSDAKYYRCKARLKDNQVSYVQMDFSKSDYKMVGAYFEAEQRDPSDPQYHRLSSITIRNVKHTVDDAVFDLRHIYTLMAGKAVLSKKYSKYNLTLLAK